MITEIGTNKTFVGQKLWKNKIKWRVQLCSNIFMSLQARSALPENGGNVKRGKKDGTTVCAQGVSYGRNFLTLSGALTACPGGHINLVSLNKVL